MFYQFLVQILTIYVQCQMQLCFTLALSYIHTYIYFHSPSSVKHDCIRTWNTSVYQYNTCNSNAHCSLSEFTNLQNLYLILNSESGGELTLTLFFYATRNTEYIHNLPLSTNNN